MTDDIVLVFPRLNWPEPEPGLTPEDEAERQRILRRIRGEGNFSVTLDGEAMEAISARGFLGDDFSAVEGRIAAQYASILVGLTPAQIEEMRTSLSGLLEGIRNSGPILIDSLSALQVTFGAGSWSGVADAFRRLAGTVHDPMMAVPDHVAEAFQEPDPTAYRNDLDSHRIEVMEMEISQERVNARTLTNGIRDVLGAHAEEELISIREQRAEYMDCHVAYFEERERHRGGDEIGGRFNRSGMVAHEKRNRSRFAQYGGKELPRSGVREYRRRRR